MVRRPEERRKGSQGRVWYRVLGVGVVVLGSGYGKKRLGISRWFPLGEEAVKVGSPGKDSVPFGL